MPKASPTKLRRVRVGTWVEYSLLDVTAKRSIRLRFALVGKVGDRYWWEVRFRESGRDPVILKALVKGDLTNPRYIQRVIYQPGRGAALELPLKRGQRLMRTFLRVTRGRQMQRLGRKRLRVAAGTFDTELQTWTDDAGGKVQQWSSPRAAIWGLVLYVDSRLRLELIGQGRSARSQIRGIPVKWQLPGM